MDQTEPFSRSQSEYLSVRYRDPDAAITLNTITVVDGQLYKLGVEITEDESSPSA